MATFNATCQELQRTRYNDHMWHTVGKFHNAKHMAASFKWMSPRFNWCFRAEDYVGRIAKLSWSRAFGCKILNLTKKITEKYKLMMFIRFWKHSSLEWGIWTILVSPAEGLPSVCVCAVVLVVIIIYIWWTLLQCQWVILLCF